MQLSIVIVSYNVRHFLEQCLLSVARATRGMETETWVVDNNSADGSVEMVRSRFPWVRLIANADNPGFATANNQALQMAKGKYVLLLNPDTLVSEDTFRQCHAFSEAHADLGGLGVMMIDGSGRFLPESKRGLPTPWVAFTKAFGLARLFPASRRFGRYHQGYLSAVETHVVDVLSGAFMWMRKAALDKVGLLDEAFFMYGEDIDLSYRLTLGGYRNYYFPGTSIIHYKGESTKRGSLNYVRVFYQAMVVFAHKHFVGSQGKLLVFMMQMAIYLRAALTVMANLWQSLRFPIADATGIYFGLIALKRLWAAYHFGNPDYFPDYVDYVHFPAYTMLWAVGIFLGGGYDRPHDLGRLLRSLAVATLLLLAIYGLLPEIHRPSRALLLLGAAWATAWTLTVRTLFAYLQGGSKGDRSGRLLIVGGHEESERTLSLLQRAGASRNYLGRVGADAGAIGVRERLPTLARLYRVDEIIFCSADLDIADIQRWMIELGPNIQYRILPELSGSIIGSHRPDQRGSLYTIDVNLRITDPVNSRAKWLFDRIVSLTYIFFCPLWLIFLSDRLQRLKDGWQVFIGHRTWVGYHRGDLRQDLLPPLKPGVFYPGFRADIDDPDTLHHLNLLYARDYSVADDWRLFWEGFLGG